MRRLASLILVGAMALTAWGAPAPRGRVVRVERPRGGDNSVPILCVEFKSDGSGTCIGTMPNPGDIVLVVDATQMIAEVKVTKAQPRSPKCDTVWTITGEVVRGDVSQMRATKAIGVIDPAADRRATRRIDESKLTSPVANPEVHVALGIDRDGDGTADIVATEYGCDAQGQVTSATTAADFCIDIWSRHDKVMKRAWTTRLQACR